MVRAGVERNGGAQTSIFEVLSTEKKLSDFGSGADQ